MTWRLWLLICSLVCAACEVAHGQGVISRPVEVGSGQQQFVSGWHDLKPCRSVDASRLGKTLADIESHMQPGHQYRDSDLVTWAHETTHGINSNCRVQAGGRCNAFYCLNDFVFICREPNLRKSDVCRFVPQNLRGDVWGLYMVGQTEWDDRPTYILDEWVAYINGAITGREIATGNRSTEYDVRHCIEFAGYASALLVAIEKLDPNYPDKAKLQDFVAYNVKRTMKLTEPQAFTEQVRRFEVAYAGGMVCQGGQCGTLQWQSNVWVQKRPILGGTKTIVTQPKAVITTPAQPLVPVTKPAPIGCNCAGEIAALKAEIAKLSAVAKEPGPAGKDGANGRDGKDGKDCGPCAEQQPFTVEIYSPTGKLLQKKVVPPGGTLPLQLYLTKPTK